MRILFISDIFGKVGKRAVHGQLDGLREGYKPDIVIANGENIAGGFGITPNLAAKLHHYGVDIITGGNHTYDRDDIDDYLDENQRILRPENYPPGNRGRGYMVHELEDGRKIGIANFIGRVFMPQVDCPFRSADRVIDELADKTKTIFVDFHAETTSEKRAFANYVDGSVSAVIGTHTHVQTADEQILKGGTAFITDAGMTGPHDSVIGVKTGIVIRHMLLARKFKFAPSKEGGRFQGVFVVTDDDTGKALSIERIDIAEEEQCTE